MVPARAAPIALSSTRPQDWAWAKEKGLLEERINHDI